MKKLIAILAIAMLISGTCYATSDTTGGDPTTGALDRSLVASTVLEIEVLDAFFLIVPDDMTIDVNTDTGQVQSEDWINVLAGCANADQDWYLKFKCSNFVKTTDPGQTFGPETLDLAFSGAIDADEDEIGEVLNDYDNYKPMPAADTYVNVYQPLTDNRQGTHGCGAVISGTMPSSSTGTYTATLTFEMVPGLPA